MANMKNLGIHDIFRKIQNGGKGYRPLWSGVKMVRTKFVTTLSWRNLNRYRPLHEASPHVFLHKYLLTRGYHTLHPRPNPMCYRKNIVTNYELVGQL